MDIFAKEYKSIARNNFKYAMVHRDDALLEMIPDIKHKETLEWMLHVRKANPNATTRDGLTPLHLTRNLDHVKLLLAAGANPNAINRYGQSVLQPAIIRGDKQLIALLLDAKALPNVPRTDGNTLLHWTRNTPEIAQMLLNAGADFHAINRRGLRPIRSVYNNPPLQEFFDKYEAVRKRKIRFALYSGMPFKRIRNHTLIF